MLPSLEKSVCFTRTILRLIFGMALVSPLQLIGAEQPAELTQQPDQADSLEYIDTPRDYLSGKIISYAKNIDSFFGDDRNYQESNKSMVQFALTRASGYGGNDSYVFSARANLSLPSTEKRLHLLVESNPDQNITGEPPQNQENKQFTEKVDTPQSYGLALRYEKLKEELKALHLSADAGVKFQGIHIDPFVRARGSYSIPLDKWRMKAFESVFWFNTIGAGETTQIDFEHILSEPVLFRASSNATWLNEQHNFDLRQDLSIYQTVNDRSALLYQASATGISNPQYQVTDYVLLLLYRYRLHRNWIFFEVSPQVHFPKIKDYRRSAALNMRLEILFDGSK